MRFAKVIVSVTALLAFMALAAGASAEPLTSPAGTPYEGTLHAESESFEMHGEAFSFNCKSTLAAEFGSQASTTTATGNITSLSFNECSFPTTVKALGTLQIHATGKGNATVTWTGGEFTVDGPFGIQCLYKTNATDIGTLTGSTTTGSTATLDIGTSLIPRTGDSAFCGAYGELTGSYKFTSPDYLGVD